MLIYACSSNPGKLREFGLAASQFPAATITLRPLPGLKDIPPPEETGNTFEANATQKALYYSRFTSETVLADDSGIELDALGGAPGVHSARYAGPGATAEDNNRLLLANMSRQTNRAARFICAIALAKQERLIHLVRGVVEGQLLAVPSGPNGFGYDPLFFYPPFATSFGELDDVRKFAVSHRGNALRQLMTLLAK